MPARLKAVLNYVLKKLLKQNKIERFMELTCIKSKFALKFLH